MVRVMPKNPLLVPSLLLNGSLALPVAIPFQQFSSSGTISFLHVILSTFQGCGVFNHNYFFAWMLDCQLFLSWS